MVRQLRRWVDQLMIYARDESAFTRLANSFVEESPGNRAEPATGARDFSPIMNKYCNLKQINFYTHGNVGYVHLAGGGVVESTVSLFLPPHPNLFLDEGRVLFIGCNVGEGQEGRNFLIAAGKTLLKGKGGFVGGTTSKNLFGRWGIFDARMPRWGSLRVIKLDPSGNVVTERLF
jgi:hypothetical protein